MLRGKVSVAQCGCLVGHFRGSGKARPGEIWRGLGRKKRKGRRLRLGRAWEVDNSFPAPSSAEAHPPQAPPALAFSTLASPPDLCESLTDALLHDPELLPSRCGVACQKRPRADPYLLDAGSVPRINRWHWESWVHRRTGTSYVYIIVLPPP
jgi:hypothetical protein